MHAFGIVGSSGSGKTALIERLIPVFSLHGLRTSVIKHAHHGFGIEQPGKDSDRYREVGAEEIMLASDQRWVLMRNGQQQHAGLADSNRSLSVLKALLPLLSNCDLVLVEGFKAEPFPKLEVWRPACKQPAWYPQYTDIIAIATDADRTALLEERPIHTLELNDTKTIAAFILNYLFDTPEGR